MVKRSYLQLALWILVVQGIGLLLGLLTSNNITSWYNLLHKSALTPPPIVFSLVWPLLYLLLAVIGWHLWQKQQMNHSSQAKSVWYLFVAQMLMNWLWTPLFFQFHLIGLSLIWISLLTLLTALIIGKLIPKHWILGLLLLPYVTWLLFATYLTAVIYYLN